MEEKKISGRKAGRGKIWYTLTPALVFVLISVVGSVLIVRLFAAGGFRDVSSIPGIFPDGIPGGKISGALLASLEGSLLTILVQLFFRSQDTRELGKEHRTWFVPWILLGIAVVTGVGILENVLISVSRLNEILPDFRLGEAVSYFGQNKFLLFLAVAVLGPIAEELAFRGVMQRRARTWLGPIGAILLTAVVFSVFHLNLVQMIYAFPLGILLGILYEKSGTLLAPLAAHVVLNVVSLVLS